MDDKKYGTLSCLASIRCYKKDEVIYNKSDESLYCYIVIRGCVVDAGNEEHNPRKLEFGSLFGEVSLITDTPYFTSTFANGKTFLFLCFLISDFVSL
jgi:signal-transduction protein with cAMP-binding, CBS, and nucleotidyltransferase domain